MNRLRVLDVMSVPADGDPNKAVRSVSLPLRMAERECDVLVVGGGTGGTAAALASSRHGMSTILTEETDWVGGQLTAQGVSALDEHEFIESFGGTRSYYQCRDRIRARYRARHPTIGNVNELNPGGSWVTKLAFEPRVALSVLEGMLSERRSNLELVRRTKAIAAEMDGDRVAAVIAVHLETGECVRYRGTIVIDATELGDLLLLTGTECIIGAEPRAMTNEAHARSEACEDCVQSLTYPAAVVFGSFDEPAADQPPPLYGHYRDSQPYGLRIHVTGGEIYSEASGWLEYDMFTTRPGTKGGLWTYRRILDRILLGPPATRDISILNWPGNDYRDRSLLRLGPSDQATALQEAKWVSLGFVHWLRTEAPAPWGSGYPSLRTSPETYGTVDGLSKHPYIRESRRIVPLRRVLEEDVSADAQPDCTAARFEDSIGVGWYPIDIHAAHADEGAVSLRTRPFQIPMSSLMPTRVVNLIAGSKCMGTTHVTNGCYRLHPVEWNVGEAAGTSAATAVRRAAKVQDVATEPTLRRTVQSDLVNDGVPLFWVRDIGVDHPAFGAVQFGAVDGRIDPVSIKCLARNLPRTVRRDLGC